MINPFLITTMDRVNENRESFWRSSWFVRLVVISVLLLAASVPPYLDLEEPRHDSQAPAHGWIDTIRSTHLLS